MNNARFFIEVEKKIVRDKRFSEKEIENFLSFFASLSCYVDNVDKEWEEKNIKVLKNYFNKLVLSYKKDATYTASHKGENDKK